MSAAPLAAGPIANPLSPAALQDFHFPLASFRWDRDDGWMKGSLALLCRAPVPRTAVVFVHGWGGKSTGSWEAFPRAFRHMPQAASADALFFGYPSTTHSVSFCANKFRTFLQDVVQRPAESVVNLSLPRNEPRRPPMRYEHVVIVAHSMGAVVARSALLQLDQDVLAPVDLDRIRLLFFAPAHRGSHLPLLIASGLGLDKLPGSALVGSALMTYYRSLRDLAVGSHHLTTFHEACKTVREAHVAKNEPYEHLRARVYHAQGDKVVEQDDFDRDHPTEPTMRRNHRSICKPDQDYRAPVRAVEGLL